MQPGQIRPVCRVMKFSRKTRVSIILEPKHPPNMCRFNPDFTHGMIALSIATSALALSHQSQSWIERE